jgi:hypothetical protein
VEIFSSLLGVEVNAVSQQKRPKYPAYIHICRLSTEAVDNFVDELGQSSSRPHWKAIYFKSTISSPKRRNNENSTTYSMLLTFPTVLVQGAAGIAWDALLVCITLPVEQHS